MFSIAPEILKFQKCLQAKVRRLSRAQKEELKDAGQEVLRWTRFIANQGSWHRATGLSKDVTEALIWYAKEDHADDYEKYWKKEKEVTKRDPPGLIRAVKLARAGTKKRSCPTKDEPADE